MSPSVLRLALAPPAVLLVLLLFTPGSSHVTRGAVHASVSSDHVAARALFHEKGCEHCHGVDGLGGEKGPNLSGVGRELKPDQIRKQILEGGDAMPPFADALAPSETDLLVSYLSTRKKIVKARGPAGAPVQQPVPKPDRGGSDDQ